MKIERKQIIIDEIKHWKINKLLPETYCDFLLALYTGGKQEEPVKKKKRSALIMPYLILLLLPLSLFIYFTEMNPPMQIGLLTVFVLSVLPALNKSRRQGMFFYYMGVLFLLLLLLSLTGISFAPLPKGPSSAIAIIIHSFIWILFAIRFKMRTFFIAGSAGILLSAASFLF
ncbi:hypothetical protein J9317_13215 [Metabacillus sp. KIGAM252]|uniref:Uncharacterized protein n=1 Tax=Metabacillus flavus TaxID=2823519 RepID=A0ABS5LGI8_9BACI|nr:hypothetical protein [Metabacillus flavus]MBS2969726.1 hypothetical protein [Metabacillus flavus]